MRDRDGFESMARPDSGNLQRIWLDFDGAVTSYQGELLTLPTVTVADSGFTPERIELLLASLNQHFSGVAVFTAVPPEEEDFSTVFIGKSPAFDPYGDFLGMAETLDVGNRIRNDKAFVLLDATAEDVLVHDVIIHEVGHLLGATHGPATGTLADYAFTENEGPGNWNDTMSTAEQLGRIGSSTVSVSGSLSVRWYEADVDYYRFVPNGSKLNWKVMPVGYVNTVNVTLWSSSGKLLSVLSNNDYAIRSGVCTVTPGATYYIRVDSSVSGLGAYRFSLSSTGSGGSSGGVTVPGRPDLSITKFQVRTKTPQAGKKLQLSVSIKNLGTATAAANTLYVYVDGKRTGSIALRKLSRNQTSSFILSWNKLSYGSHTIKIVADGGSVTGDSNRSNNEASVTVFCDAPDLTPSFVGTTATLRSTPPDTTRSTTLRFRVTNDSSVAASSYSTAYVYVDNVLHKKVLVGLLGKGKSSLKNLSLGRLTYGNHTVRVETDALNKIAESDERNNSFSQTFFVDAPDLECTAAVGRVTSSRNGRKTVSVTVDVHNDSTVSTGRFCKLALNYGILDDSGHRKQLNARTVTVLIGSLKAGMTTTKTIKFSSVSGLSDAETFWVELQLDSSGVILESDESNNRKEFRFTERSALLPEQTLPELPTPGSPSDQDDGKTGPNSGKLFLAAGAFTGNSTPEADTTRNGLLA